MTEKLFYDSLYCYKSERYYLLLYAIVSRSVIVWLNNGIGGLEVKRMGRARISNLLGIALVVIVGCSVSAQGKYGGGSDKTKWGK